MDPILALFLAFGGFALMLVACWFVSMPWQAAALRRLHRVVFYWHRDHVFFLQGGPPDPDARCAVCNERLRYIRGVTLEDKRCSR